jgi:hypothetical protein
VIKEITKFIETESYILILDRPNNCILKFSKDGKYISKIQQTGKGPTEYLVAFDMTIVDEEIFLLDFTGRKVKCYDLQTFDFRQSFDLPINAAEMSLIQDKLFFFCINQAEKASWFTICNIDGSNQKKILDNQYPQSWIEIWGQSVFIGENLFSRFYESNLYFYDKGEYGVKFSIDFGTKNIPDYLSKGRHIDAFNKGFNYYFRLRTFNYKDILLVDFLKDMKRQYFYYNNSNRKSCWGSIKNDILYGDFLPFNPNFISDGNLIGVFTPDLFTDHIDIKELKNIKISDNPIIVYYELK